MKRKPRHKSPQPKKAAFLAAFAVCGNVTRACQTAKIDRKTHWNWMEGDTDGSYKAAFDEAGQEAADRLEEEARRRAHDGLMRIKFHQGRMITIPGPDGKMIPYVEHEYSDTLLIFLLKAARPKKFRENSHIEHTGADGGPIKAETMATVVTDLERCSLRFDDFARKLGSQRVLPPNDN